MSTEPSSQKIPLHRAFTFHFSFYKQLLRSKRITSAVSYASHLNQIATFQTIQEFWAYYQHMIRPEQLPLGCEFFLFEDQVKPMWEDTRNIGGGIFRLFVKKQYGNRFWEDLVLGIIGEQCELSLNITGIGIEVRDKECVMSLWVDNEIIDNPIKRDIIKDWIKKTLGITQQASGDISWKKHEYSEYNQGDQQKDKVYKKKPFQDYHNDPKRFDNKKKGQNNVEELMGRRGETWRKQNDQQQDQQQQQQYEEKKEEKEEVKK